MKTYIIAEAGVNHNGKLDMAIKLCEAAKKARADAIKFQTWITDNIIINNTPTASYQALNIQDDTISQYDMLKNLELSQDDFIKIQNYCNKIGIDFLSTPDDEESLHFLVDTLRVPLIKIGSGEISNIPYLRKIGETKLPIILSTGMSSISETARAYEILMDAGCPKITLLHCTTNYPCPPNEVNLKAMLTLKEAFHCPVGYSDHTEGIEIPIAAVTLGACIIEKHFTLDRNLEGPDHKASLNPELLKTMIENIRNVEIAMGDGIKKPQQSEKIISTVVRKNIIAKLPINKGDLFSDENLTTKRSKFGIPASQWDTIIGLKATKNYNIDEPIEL